MASKKILIIDDEPEMLSMLSEFLGSAGYEVSTAEDGQAGLEAAGRLLPDLILTDLQMPKVDGWLICSRLKADARLQNTPIIMFSGLLVADGKADKTIEQCDYLMAKPIQMTQLLEKVREFLKPS